MRTDMRPGATPDEARQMIEGKVLLIEPRTARFVLQWVWSEIESFTRDDDLFTVKIKDHSTDFQFRCNGKEACKALHRKFESRSMSTAILPKAPNSATDALLGHQSSEHGLIGDPPLERQEGTPVSMSIAIICCYLLVGYLFYGSRNGWSLIDCIYFGVVTVSTVGYGDLVPQHTIMDHFFTLWFAFFGVGIVGMAIGELVDAVAEWDRAKFKKAQEAILKETADALNAAKHVTEGHNLPVPSAGNKANSSLKLAAKVYSSVAQYALPLIFAMLLGAVVLNQYENIPVNTGIYVSFITAMTTGFGDYAPKSQTGRMLFAIYIPFSVLVLINSVRGFTRLLKNMRTRKVVEVISLKEMMVMDKDGDGSISKPEYVVYMLQAMAAIQPETVAALEAQFNMLDRTADGAISMEDFPPNSALRKTVKMHKGQRSVLVDVVSSQEQANADSF